MNENLNRLLFCILVCNSDKPDIFILVFVSELFHIINTIDMNEEDFNTYLLTFIIYLFIQSDNLLSELLITTTSYGLLCYKIIPYQHLTK